MSRRSVEALLNVKAEHIWYIPTTHVAIVVAVVRHGVESLVLVAVVVVVVTRKSIER